jgi:hypothetical protein
VDFDVARQLLIMYSTFAIYSIKIGYDESVHQLFIYLKKAYDSVRREVLYNMLNEFGIPMKLVRPINMCLNETCSRVGVGKYLSDIILIHVTCMFYYFYYNQQCKLIP